MGLPQTSKLLQSQVLCRMYIVICATNPVPEKVQHVPETVKPATPAANKNKDDDDDDSDTTQVVEPQIEKEVHEASVEEIAEEAVESEAGFETSSGTCL